MAAVFKQSFCPTCLVFLERIPYYFPALSCIFPEIKQAQHSYLSDSLSLGNISPGTFQPLKTMSQPLWQMMILSPMRQQRSKWTCRGQQAYKVQRYSLAQARASIAFSIHKRKIASSLHAQNIGSKVQLWICQFNFMHIVSSYYIITHCNAFVQGNWPEKLQLMLCTTESFHKLCR